MTKTRYRPALTGLMLAILSVLPAAVADDTTGKPTTADIPQISWDQAVHYIDRQVEVVGTIVHTGKSVTGHVFLNFDSDIRNTLTLFIPKTAVERFPQPPEEYYRDQTVRVRGRIYDYHGCPNISLTGPADIRLTGAGQVQPPPLPQNPPSPATEPAVEQPPKPKRSSIVLHTRGRTLTTRPTSQPLTQPAEPAQPAGGQTTIPRVVTIASYNVLNLFDAHDDPYRGDEAKDAKPLEETAALALCLRELDADIVALQEVENRGALQAFVDQFLPKMGYQHVVHFEGNDRRGIDVALLSRLPIGPVTSYRHVTWNGRHFPRDLLRVRIEPPGAPPFEVFVVHFRSKGGTENGGLETRLAEAQMVRRVFDEMLHTTPVCSFVICGDFNDYIDSRPLQIVLGQGPTALRSFADELPEDRRISYNLPPYLSMIDFILASPAMADRYLPGSYRIAEGPIYKTASDHYPVVAEFRLE